MTERDVVDLLAALEKAVDAAKAARQAKVITSRTIPERDVIAAALLAARRLGWRWHDSWDQGSGWRQIELRPPGSTKATFVPSAEVWRFEAPERRR